MKLIAKKPCSFGGQKFYIGDEVPAKLVADPKKQESYGTIAIVNNEDSKGVPDGQTGTLFTQEEVDDMIATAVETTTAELQQTQDELQQAVAELKETEPVAYNGTIQIAVKGESDGENEQIMSISATPEEIQQVFSIMQLNASEGAEAIARVESENVLILLHATDSRKTIKDAAKKQVNNLFPADGDQNSIAGADMEGVDT